MPWLAGVGSSRKYSRSTPPTPPTPPPPSPSPQGPTSPEPVAPGGAFIHGLIGLSSGGFAETVRNSISSRTWRECKESKEFSEVKKDKAGDHVPVLYMGPHGAHPRRLLTLPPELLLAILQQLDLADIMRLRKTCKHLHALASPEQIRTLMGPAQLRMQLLGHCKTCLRHDPFRSGLLQPALNDPAYPLASSCIDCAVKARDPRIKVGRALMLANFDTAWVCRYCGLPIVEGAAFGHEQFHRFCYKRYNDRLLLFFLLGWLQWGLGIVAAALAWKYYRHAVLVFAPTVTNFLLLWFCLGFLIFRGNRRRTYHCTLVLELAILGLWTPPVYYVATELASPRDVPVPKSTQATLAMFGLNMLFRLFNLVGNIVLLCRLDTTERHRSGVPAWKRPAYYLATFLIMWTYPQSLEEKSSPEDM
ncbi:hypothetical protein BT67DRAFT_452161 [Trichocladium antarcticum]|uniref:F-box domain-containing protein n=1 Tax=Trichocladium antarcticum TaxID=1450529 RepID=A0AAN6ZA89_9PEZI|nr:hypothetical protein BT67DRAFT_452161 [Trichocladium antarcticum]